MNILGCEQVRVLTFLYSAALYRDRCCTYPFDRKCNIQCECYGLPLLISVPVIIYIDEFYLYSRALEHVAIECLRFFQYADRWEKMSLQSMHSINSGSKEKINIKG